MTLILSLQGGWWAEGGGHEARAGREKGDFVQSGTGVFSHNLEMWTYHPIKLSGVEGAVGDNRGHMKLISPVLN